MKRFGYVALASVLLVMLIAGIAALRSIPVTVTVHEKLVPFAHNPLSELIEKNDIDDVTIDDSVWQYLNTRDGYALLPIHHAVAKGRLGFLRELLKRGADPNAIVSSPGLAEDGYTPLHFASCYGQDEAAKTLLDAGADTRLKASDGATARELAIERGLTNIAAMIDNAVRDERETGGSSP